MRNSPETSWLPLLLTIPTAAAHIAVSRSTFYLLLRSGEIRPVHVGRSVRIPLTELEHWVAAKVEAEHA